MNKTETQSKKFGAKLTLGGLALVAFIGMWEGGKSRDGSSVAYADRLANNLPTVCAGLTHHTTTTPIIVGQTWSKEKCQAEESRALATAQLDLEKCFKILPPQSVFDAATSHAWNVGVGSTCKSAAMKAWNEGNWALGCQRISMSDSGKRVWSFVTAADGSKKFVQGLANRRDAETKMCLTDIENPKNVHTPMIDSIPVQTLVEVIASPLETRDAEVVHDETKSHPWAKIIGISASGILLGALVISIIERIVKK